MYTDIIELIQRLNNEEYNHRQDRPHIAKLLNEASAALNKLVDENREMRKAALNELVKLSEELGGYDELEE